MGNTLWLINQTSAEESGKAALLPTVRRRLKKQGRFWTYVVILIVGFPVAAFLLWQLLAIYPWVWAATCLVLLIGYVVGFAAAVYYVPPAIDPVTAKEYLSLILANDGKGFSRVQKACLQLPDAIVDTLLIERPTLIPIINPVDAAYHLLQTRGDQLAEREAINVSAVHIIPPGRSEAYFWNTDRAKEYFQLQRSMMTQGKMRLRRLILTAKAWPLPLNEINVWFAQVNIGTEVRWLHADNTSPLPQHALDFLVLELTDPANPYSLCDVLIELPQADGVPARILLYHSEGGARVGHFEEYSEWFETHWNRGRLFEIPTDKWWNEGSTLARVAGEGASEHAVLAFYNATRMIKGSRQFIKAVDVSDLKESLSAVYDDPAYTAWYEATLAKCREGVPLERVFVMRRTPQGIDEFIKRHLPSYFDAHGGRLPAASVSVVFYDDLKSGITTYPTEMLEAWLQEHALIVEHLQHVGQWVADDPRRSVETAVARDFLLTERMIYDYRSGTARFDFEKLEDFLLFPDDEDKASLEKWAALTAEWSDLVEFLKMLGAARTGATREELEHVLQQAKASLMVNSNALELIESLDTIKLNRHRIVGDYFRHGAGPVAELRSFVAKIRQSLGSGKQEAFLVWGASGSGKTFLIEELMKADGLEIETVKANLSKDNRQDLEAKLAKSKGGKKPVLCFIDEIDGKPSEDWPYDAIFALLGSDAEPTSPVVYVMAGSFPGGLAAMKTAMSSRFKGPDLINRVGENVVEIDQFSPGDRLVIAIAALRGAAKSGHRAINMIEKRALLYILTHPDLVTGHQLRQFCDRVVQRLGSTEDFVRFGHLFDPNESDQRDKWIASLSGIGERLSAQYVDIEG